MEKTIGLAVCTLLNVVCLFVGVKVGMSVVKDEPIEIPSINPIQAYRERQSNKQLEREQEKIATIMENIENYDGTGANQKDVSE